MLAVYNCDRDYYKALDPQRPDYHQLVPEYEPLPQLTPVSPRVTAPAWQPPPKACRAATSCRHPAGADSCAHRLRRRPQI